ncbi:MAG: hypothetical protein V1725_01325 [archaeon]
MGLLNHLFGTKKNLAQELVRDDARRMALWKEHLANFEKREQLSSAFTVKRIDYAVQHAEETKIILQQMLSLISPEFVTVTDEEKNEEELVADLNRLKSKRELEKLTAAIVSAKQKQAHLLKLFQELFRVLQAELHIIRRLLQKQDETRTLLPVLFDLVFHREARIYMPFKERLFSDESMHMHQEIVCIARAILLEEEVHELQETDNEKFARKLARQMAPDEKKRTYRELGESIFLALGEKAGMPFMTGDVFEEGIQLMHELMSNDDEMHTIIKELRPKYDDRKIQIIILAFREAYTLDHFQDLESEFTT